MKKIISIVLPLLFLISVISLCDEASASQRDVYINNDSIIETETITKEKSLVETEANTEETPLVETETITKEKSLVETEANTEETPLVETEANTEETPLVENNVIIDSESIVDIKTLDKESNNIQFFVQSQDYQVLKGKKPGYGDGDDAFELGYITANGLLFADTDEWHEGSFDFPAMSIVYHYNKHGDEVNADSAKSYLNKAIEYRRTAKKGVKPSKVSGEIDGVLRYRKNGKYIDLAPNGKIVSFGKV